jgi:hypothetical protein
MKAGSREASHTGDLPDRLPDRVWGGGATGARCAVCGVSTMPGEAELELEFAGDMDAGRRTYHVHARCFWIFSDEIAHLSD